MHTYPIGPFRAELRNAVRRYKAKRILRKQFKVELDKAARAGGHSAFSRWHRSLFLSHRDVLHNVQQYADLELEKAWPKLVSAAKVLRIAETESVDAALLWKLAN